MKSKLTLLLSVLFIFMLIGCSTGADDNNQSTEEPTQSTGNAETTPEKEPEEEHQIIATTVALVEIMDKLELDLTAVPTSYKALPARYDGLPEIGNSMSPDLELIMSLQPTEVMSVSTLEADLEEGFSNTDVNINYYDLESLDSMLTVITKIGERYNRTEQAEAIVEEYVIKQTEIEAEIAGQSGPSVLILLGVPGSYLIATDKSYIGDLVKRAGGTNVFADDEVEFISVNTEHLQQSDPDIILRAAHGLPDDVVKMFDEEFATDDIWKHFTAIENDKVYDLEETLFGTTANLAAKEALDVLMDILYPVE